MKVLKSPWPQLLLMAGLVTTLCLAGDLRITAFDAEGLLQWTNPYTNGTVVVQSLCRLDDDSRWTEVTRVRVSGWSSSAELPLCDTRAFYRLLFLADASQDVPDPPVAEETVPEGIDAAGGAAAAAPIPAPPLPVSGVVAVKDAAAEEFTLLEEQGQTSVRVDRSMVDSPEWQEAIRRAKQHQGVRGQYTLLRVILKDGATNEVVQATATKLKKFTAEYNGGGGTYRTLRHGEFLLWQHIRTSKRRDNRDPLRIGHDRYGQADLWVEVPPNGELNVFGDVILEPCAQEKLGRLEISLESDSPVDAERCVIGPVVVGGPYGTTYRLSGGKNADEIWLTPGTYKILMPDFDVRRSRWFFTVLPHATTRLDFTARSQTDLELTDETVSPIAPM